MTRIRSSGPTSAVARAGFLPSRTLGASGLVLILVAASGAVAASDGGQPGDGGPIVEWARGFGRAVGDGVAVDHAGNVVISGYFQRTSNFEDTTLVSAGFSDVFAAKLDAQGDLLWARSLGGAGRDTSRGMAVDDEGNVVITGELSGDVFVAKLDGADGNVLWIRSFAGLGVNDASGGVAIDADGDIIVAGWITGATLFGVFPVRGGIFAAKLDTNGVVLWARSFGGGGALAVAVDAGGDAVLTGWFRGTVRFDTSQVASRGSTDIFVVMLDGSLGTVIWARSVGGGADPDNWGSGEADYGRGVAVFAGGDVALTGEFGGTAGVTAEFGDITLTSNGRQDMFAARFDGTNGEVLWARGFGSAVTDRGFGVAVDEDKMLVAGQVLGDVFVAKLDGATGASGWAGSFDSSYGGRGTGVAVGRAGDALVTGDFLGTIRFGDTALESSAWLFASDVFAVRLADAPAALALVPGSDTGSFGEEHTVTATVNDVFGDPVGGATVRFNVSGRNAATGSETTDAEGNASFTYTGCKRHGEDTITAFVDSNHNSVQDPGEPAAMATKTWERAVGPPPVECRQ